MTDEGLYLFSADSLDPLASFNSPFGSITSIIYSIADKEIWKFRFLGALLLTLAGISLGIALNKYVDNGNVNVSSRKIKTVFISICGVIPYYGLGIWTPNYNWLNLFAILLGLSGAVRFAITTEDGKFFDGLLGSFLLAIALVIGTFAKPSTFLSVILMIFLVSVYRRVTLLELFWKIISVLFFVFVSMYFVFLYVDEPEDLKLKFIRGYEALKIMDPNYSLMNSILSIPRSTALLLIENRLILICCMAFLVVNFILFKKQSAHYFTSARSSNIYNRFFLFAPDKVSNSIFFVAVLILLTGLWRGTTSHYVSQSRAAVSLFFVTVASLIIFREPEDRFDGNRRKIYLIISLVVLSCATYAFGSGNGFAPQLSGVSGLALITFWIVLVLGDYKARTDYLFLMIALLSVASSALNSNYDPYRRLPTPQQNVSIQVENRGNIWVDKVTASSFFKIQKDLKVSGWRESTPMLDLSSFSTSIVYMHRGLTPSTILPTVNSYYSANALARWSLNLEVENGKAHMWKCAWLITDRLQSTNDLFSRPKNVDPRIVDIFGNKFPEDYRVISELSSIIIWQPNFWNKCLAENKLRFPE